MFLGQFLADLAFQRLPQYSVAGLQAGLAIPFTFLATIGPEWGSFTTVRTRLAGLLVAGITAVVVHAFVWPVLPMRQLRESIAAALRATAESLVELFDASRATWKGSPPSLRQAILRARDLLDDARYLPGPEHADLTYHEILAALQEIDASLEYIHLLISLEAENPYRQQFFTLLPTTPQRPAQIWKPSPSNSTTHPAAMARSTGSRMRRIGGTPHSPAAYRPLPAPTRNDSSSSPAASTRSPLPPSTSRPSPARSMRGNRIP